MKSHLATTPKLRASCITTTWSQLLFVRLFFKFWLSIPITELLWLFCTISTLQMPLSKKIQDYHESGYIDDLIDVHFADSQCYKQRIKQEDSRLEVQHHAGSFVMLSVGIIVGIGILFLEHAVYKWLVPKFRNRQGRSLWKSVHVMFFSQVSWFLSDVSSNLMACY